MTKSEYDAVSSAADLLVDIVLNQVEDVTVGLRAGLDDIEVSDSDYVSLQNSALLAVSTLVAAAYTKK